MTAIGIIKELIAELDEIPCQCDEAYKKIPKRDPHCPRCNWVDEKVLEKAKEYVK